MVILTVDHVVRDGPFEWRKPMYGSADAKRKSIRQESQHAPDGQEDTRSSRTSKDSLDWVGIHVDGRGRQAGG